ncbi:hypothetical protein [Oceanobacillus sp. CAU 1775]
MRKNLFTSVLFIFLALVLAACGSSNDEDASQADGSGDTENVEEQSAVEREMLDLTYEVSSIDVVNGNMEVTMDTNLPAGTEIYRLVLKDDEGKDRFVAYEFTIDEENVLGFALKGADKEALLDKELQLSLELNVTERTNSDLFEDKQFAGSYEEMNEAYADSENVVVKEVGVDDAYTITFTSSNTEVITEDHFVEE